MENMSLNEKINELVVKMAKEPNVIENYHALSELYLQQQDYDKVMSVLDSLLAICPDDVQALVGMGTMWFYERDFRKSLSYYNKALEVNPKNFLKWVYKRRHKEKSVNGFIMSELMNEFLEDCKEKSKNPETMKPEISELYQHGGGYARSSIAMALADTCDNI